MTETEAYNKYKRVIVAAVLSFKIYSREPIEDTELFSVGCECLVICCRTYNADRGHDFSSFLYITCRQKMVDYLRRTKWDSRRKIQNLKRVEWEFAKDNEPAVCQDVDHFMRMEECLDAIEKNIATERHRKIFNMRRQGLLFSEIADRLGLSVSTIKSDFSRLLYRIGDNEDRFVN